MSGEKIAIRAILCYLWGERLNAKAVSKKINNVEGPGTVNKSVAQNWCRHFKEGETLLQRQTKVRETCCGR